MIWKAGDAIAVRTVRENARVGTAFPVTVVRDDAELIAVYLALGAVCMRRVGTRGGPGGRLLIEDSGRHEAWTWARSHRLFLVRPGEMHAVSLFWREDSWELTGWYIDVMEPWRRSAVGFDTRDLVLDVVISPDRTWRWKDQDELAWSEEQGLLAPYDAASIRQEAERAVELLARNDPLFSEEWEMWQPDPAWAIPELLEGWDRV